MSGIVYQSMLSHTCFVELHEFCTASWCEDYCHDTADLLQLDLSPKADDVSILHAEARFEAGRDD